MQMLRCLFALMKESQKLLFSNRCHRVSFTIGVDEFDFKNARRKNFNDGADLSSEKVFLWEIGG